MHSDPKLVDSSEIVKEVLYMVKPLLKNPESLEILENGNFFRIRDVDGDWHGLRLIKVN